jgi:hypothetical protein
MLERRVPELMETSFKPFIRPIVHHTVLDVATTFANLGIG